MKDDAPANSPDYCPVCGRDAGSTEQGNLRECNHCKCRLSPAAWVEIGRVRGVLQEYIGYSERLAKLTQILDANYLRIRALLTEAKCPNDCDPEYHKTLPLIDTCCDWCRRRIGELCLRSAAKAIKEESNADST